MEKRKRFLDVFRRHQRALLNLPPGQFLDYTRHQGIMKTLSAFLLVGLLVLWSEMPPASGQPNRGAKPGYCPVERCMCLRIGPRECRNDYSCRGTQKCCFTCCVMRCVDPVKEPPLP
ncbi:porwaprin-b-like [Hemicordylus capensis]|uniref:porwaprin-b-like n=1 Tax=Hemicordylus capensis TaxID=884348 RepID=UPI00230276CA|nr:porwaprin-b-like [Hemicordylus capensis]